MRIFPQQARLATPIGEVIVEGDDRAICAIRIARRTGDAPTAPGDGPVGEAIVQLAEYFAGERRKFDLPLAAPASPRGAVLRGAIAGVPYGETLSYGALARIAGSGAQAMGQACARNPFPIVIPCHRVTSAGGAPEKYSAGEGPATKAWLLAHEQLHCGD